MRHYFFTVAYNHMDTGETVTRYCETRQSAAKWAEWIMRQAWVEPGSVRILLGDSGTEQ